MEGSAASSNQIVRMIEEFGLNGWPALQQMSLDGWSLRFADGFTRRANSVQSLYPPLATPDLNTRVELCEGIYAARGLPAVFRITPASRPGGLDQYLSSRAYRREGETIVLVRSAGAGVESAGLQPSGFDDSGPDTRVLLSESPGDEWLLGVAEIRGRPPATISLFRNQVSKLVTRSCFVMLYAGDQPAACAMGVLQQNWVGIYEVARKIEFRGRGYGRAALELVEDWARAYGAMHAYLSCAATNRPGLQMYADCGYGELYRYWYRSQNVRH